MFRVIFFLVITLSALTFCYSFAAEKTASPSANIESIIKPKVDEIIAEKNYQEKLEKLTTLTREIRQNLDQTKDQKEDWASADMSFDFLKQLFVLKLENEFLNCKTIFRILSGDDSGNRYSDEIKKQAAPYIQLSTRLAKNLCDARPKDAKP